MQEGVLLVLCSLVENMPYVVVEASTANIPFVIFDVGEVVELIQRKDYANVNFSNPYF